MAIGLAIFVSQLALAQNVNSLYGALSIQAPAGTSYRILGTDHQGDAPAFLRLPSGRADVILIRRGNAERLRTVDIQENKVAYVRWDDEATIPKSESVRASSNADLTAFFRQEGFKSVELHDESSIDDRVNANHLIISAAINDEKARLMIDTGSAMCAVTRSKLHTFRLSEEKTSHPVRGSLASDAGDFFGKATLERLTILYPLERGSSDAGTITINNVPVLVAAIPYVDGVLGLDHLRMTGSVLDCKEKMLYVAPYGSIARTSQRLGELLRKQGYTSVHLALNGKRHFAVRGFVNTIPCAVVIDTGSALTCIDRAIGKKAGVTFEPTSKSIGMGLRPTTNLSTGRVNKFSVGSFDVGRIEAAFVDFREPGGLLGIDQLQSRSAVLDAGGATLYLK